MRGYIATVVSALALIRLCIAERRLEKDPAKYQPMEWNGEGLHSSSCLYGFDFEDGSVIESGKSFPGSKIESDKSFSSPGNSDIYLEQWDDGSLIVREGERILWESGKSESTGDYWTELMEDGYLATYKGEPKDRDDLIWTSASSRSAGEPYWVWKPDGSKSPKGDPKPAVWRSSNGGRGLSSSYFLGLDCDFRYVGIFEGTPSEPGDWVWRERVGSEPTASPSESPTASPTETPWPFAFYVMGDVPYSPWEEDELENQIDDMADWVHPGASFTVHLGDFNKAEETDCDRDHFEKVSGILRNGPLPTFVLAGDNDYLECPDKEKAWDRYLDTFADFEKEWKANDLPGGARELYVHRWDYEVEVDGYGNVERPEMFAFFEDGILFISLALLNMKNEKPDSLFYERLAVSGSWVKRRLKQYKDEDLRGVILFSHAEHSKDLEDFFEDDLKDVFDYYGVNVPVLYLCGDAHKWDVDKRKYWSQFDYVQVDQGGCADPLIVEVAPIVDGETQWFVRETKSQYIVGDGLFRLDRQEGRYRYKNCR